MMYSRSPTGKLVGLYGRVYVNVEVSVKIVCRRLKNGMSRHARRKEEASIDVKESLSSPHQAVLSHLLNICQPAGKQVSPPNTSPCMHRSCSNHPSTRHEKRRETLWGK